MDNNKQNERNSYLDELFYHKFIIFCHDHYNPLGVVRSLGERGINPIVIVMNKRPVLLNHSKYSQIVHTVENIEDGYKLLLENYGNENKKPFLYSCSDDVCYWLDEHYDELINRFYFFHGNEKGVIAHYLNKAEINRLAENCGCDVLRYEVIPKEEMPKTLHYPVLTKALDSTLYAWKNEMNICNDESELKKAFEHIRSPKILVQEFIKKKNELCLDGFSINGGENVYIPYYTNYLRFSDMSYGGYMLLRPFIDQDTLSKVRQILKEVGYTGIFEVEFLLDDNDKLYFLEVNFRNSTWSYAYTYGGYNMPFLWALGTLKGELEIKSINPIEKFVAMSEEDDYEMMVKTKRMRLSQWIKDFYRADCHYLYNEKDSKPFYVLIARLWIKWPIRKIFHLFGKKWKE